MDGSVPAADGGCSSMGAFSLLASSENGSAGDEDDEERSRVSKKRERGTGGGSLGMGNSLRAIWRIQGFSLAILFD